MKNQDLQERQEQFASLLDEMKELSQPRTNFALRHFVVGQHDTPGRQRQQAILEINALMFELANQNDELERLKLDIEDLEANIGEKEGSMRKRAEIDLRAKYRAIEQIKIQMSGRMREVDYLYGLIQTMPKYNVETLEAEEPAYWAKRLTRQFFLSQRDSGGNLDAVLQMLTEPGKDKPELNAQLPDAIKAIGITDTALKNLLED